MWLCAFAARALSVGGYAAVKTNLAILLCTPKNKTKVEDAKRALIMHGGNTSQVIKDVLTDLHKLKGVRCFLVCFFYPGRRPVAAVAAAPAALSLTHILSTHTSSKKTKTNRRTRRR